MLSPEELLQKRYKIIAEDTSGNLKVGQVLVHDEEANAFWCGKASFTEDQLKQWPHLFKKIAWWEERKPEDMPEYVCTIPEKMGYAAIYKIRNWVLGIGEVDHDGFPYDVRGDMVLPATEHDYLTYKNKNNE